jgi:protein-tyrosine phosphatase
LDDAARAVADLRREGRTVLLHCVQAVTRTPSVAALYGARRAGIPVLQALHEVCAVLPGAAPAGSFVTALKAFDAR